MSDVPAGSEVTDRSDIVICAVNPKLVRFFRNSSTRSVTWNASFRTANRAGTFVLFRSVTAFVVGENVNEAIPLASVLFEPDVAGVTETFQFEAGIATSTSRPETGTPAKFVTFTAIVVVAVARGPTTSLGVPCTATMRQSGALTFSTKIIIEACCASTATVSGTLTNAFTISARCWFGNLAAVNGAEYVKVIWPEASVRPYVGEIPPSRRVLSTETFAPWMGPPTPSISFATIAVVSPTPM